MSSQKNNRVITLPVLCLFRALLVVQVWLGQKERQVHKVCLDRMVALGCQALRGFLLRSESFAFSV